MNDVVTQIEKLRIVPVVALENIDDANPLADALTEGGLPCAEITLRTDAGLAAIESLSKRTDFLVGAGTVHNAEQAKQVVDAGAKFVVAPGFNPKTVAWCVANHVPIFPGTSNPTDLEQALEYGLDVVKFFPAEAMGGIKMLKAFHGPYSSIRFMPTGGVSTSNVLDYLRLPYVIACGGSWMVKPNLITEGRFDQITQLTTETIQLVEQTPTPSADSQQSDSH
ncbi:MAG: bifunctional 4-hydroxy-2-oxoglutarate aldolase/2-dehydro-3-deoxy-phosphogluconate aldolase [Fuerstiella sp.]